MTGKRVQDSGSKKRKIQKRRELVIQSIAGSMDRYVKRKPTPSISNEDNVNVDMDMNDEYVNTLDENANADGENVNENVNSENENVNDENANVDGENGNENANVDGENGNGNGNGNENVNVDDLSDPGNWKAHISQKERDLLVERGPIRESGLRYPIDKKRSFSDKLYTRYLANGEKFDRPWLVYSPSKNKVFCFCCVLFKGGGVSSPLTTAAQGYNDWNNIYTRLMEHETSNEHIRSMRAWREAEVRLKKKATIDASQERAINKEKEYWRDVLKRIMVVVKTLASCNLAFRGDNEKIDDKKNGNFLKIINMIAEFDPIMQEHLRRIRKKEIRNHYLGHNIQNEMIQLLANEVKKKILQIVRNAKYFSVILDCTPDVSHEEQMTLVIRCVNVSTSPIIVEEFFITFVKVVETTGEALFHELKSLLETHELDFNNVRGQGYDNGSNMKGDNKGVQARVLREYPRAFYTPCGCHSLNLALCDMAMSCPQAKTFFGVIQRIYKLFSGSTKRWEVFKHYVKDRDGNGLTLKSWSDTRWESRIASVRAIKFQAPQIKQALEHLTKHSNDASTIVLFKEKTMMRGPNFRRYKVSLGASKSLEPALVSTITAVREDGSWSVLKPALQDMNAQVEITVAAHDTTGGMLTKVSEAAMIAKLGIDVYIVQAATSHSLTALSGRLKENIPEDWLGTVIRFVQ